MGRFIQADTVIPGIGNPQAWDRYAYANNSPVKYTDPTGHSVDCGYGDPYCRAGKLDTNARALDLAERYRKEAASGGRTVYYEGLSSEEQSILAEGGFDEGTFNAHVSDRGVSPADALHDPLTYIELLVGGTGLYRAAKELILPLFGIGTAGATASGEIQRSITVLGRYDAYLNVAKDVGGNALDIPTETWNNMSTAEQWALNQKFLDEAIARGDYFYLASRWAEARIGTFFRMELEHLFSMGYTLSPYQNYLIPPSTP